VQSAAVVEVRNKEINVLPGIVQIDVLLQIDLLKTCCTVAGDSGAGLDWPSFVDKAD